MDKRSLIFVFALTVVLMFTHQYFDSKKARVVKEQIDEYASRVADRSQLPLIQLKDGENEVWAVNVDGEFLTLGWASSLPEEVYAQVGRGKRAFLEIGGKKGEPALYTTSKDPTLATAMPHGDIQLISMNGDVTLGEYLGGSLSFPVKKPSGDAIALGKVGSEYLPVGFYLSGKLEPITAFKDLEKVVAVETTPTSMNETFYVLENESMQVVFSDSGGAIAEINLPFTDIIRPIEIDKRLKEISPENARFPLYDAFGPGKKKYESKEGGYYPLLRRGIVGEFDVQPKNYALNIVTTTPDEASTKYSVSNFTKNSITFKGNGITKTYRLPDDDVPYTLELDVKVNGNSRGLYLTSGVPEVELISGSATPALKYRSTVGGKSSVSKIKLPKTSTPNPGVTPDWVSNSNGFFGLIVDHLDKAPSGFTATMIPGNDDPTRLTLIDHEHDLYPAAKYPGYEVLLPIGYSEQSFRLFAGPYDTAILKHVDAALTNPSTGYTPDYIGCQSFHGWFSFISEPFAKFLMLIMNLFYKLTHSWGISIILITVVLRVMLYPLNAWSIKSQLKMQQVAPQVKAIQERYKNDPKRAQLEQMQLYREKGVNPFTGCIPLLIQMPFLIGMFDLLKSSFELRGASFIPGWINNLTAPDVLFSWQTPIFFFGNSFHLLPFLVGGIMFLQQKMTQSKTAVASEQQKMGTIMTVVFTFVFYNFPSGLNLYWFSSMGIGIVQQWYTSKKMAK